MNAKDDQTLSYYASHASAYIEHRADGHSRNLSGFLAQLAPGAKILELGCGGGRDAKAMIEAGFTVFPTDGTAEIADKAAKFLSIPVNVMRFDELTDIQTYDAIWANAALLHVPRNALPPILDKIWTALKPGGIHLATFKVGSAEGRDQLGRYFNYFSPDEIEALYKKSNPWHIIALTTYEGGNCGPQNMVPWVAITVKKPK